MNYSELQTTIRDYTEVEDTVLGSTTLGTIVQNAENRVFRDANIDAYRQYAVSNMVVGQRYVSVPSGLRNIRYVQVTDSSGEQQFLEQKDTSFMAEYDSTPSTTYGFPKYYANWDSNTWGVAPTPSSTSQITIAYYAQDLLIYASLVETYKFLKGPADMIQLYEQSYQQALQSFGVEQTGRRRRDEYTDGVVRVPLQSVDPSK